MVMIAQSETLDLMTKEGPQALDITSEVTAAVARSRIHTGLACVFTPSSTSAILANEFEPGLMEEDIPAALERLFPRGMDYGHERRWGDGNGHSHVRAAFVGPSLTIPVVGGELALGTWQQIVFLELDSKPRRREVLVQIVGDEGKS